MHRTTEPNQNQSLYFFDKLKVTPTQYTKLASQPNKISHKSDFSLDKLGDPNAAPHSTYIDQVFCTRSTFLVL